LAKFITSGRLQTGVVAQTITPAMDIQVPSNLERLLYDMVDQEPGTLRELMEEYAETGQLRIDAEVMHRFQTLFSAAWLSDGSISAAISDINSTFGIVVDPHTAVGLTAGRTQHRKATVPLVSVATAHPAKFPEAVEVATGVVPELPEDMADLFERVEHFSVINDSLDEVVEKVRAFSGK
jgi:threonine synthase